jgi:hypothetical protein
MKIVGAIDTSGTMPKDEVEQVTRIADTFLYVLAQYDQQKPVSNLTAMTACLTAGMMAAKLSGSEHIFEEMMKAVLEGRLISVIKIDDIDTAGNA